MIPRKLVQKAETLTDNVALNFQRDYIEKVMEWEKVDYDTAWAICQGQTDPIEYKYTLGFKMHPILALALFKQRSKKARRQAAENFAETLSDPERKMFYSEVFDMETASRWEEVWKAEEKKAKKEAKKAKRERS